MMEEKSNVFRNFALEFNQTFFYSYFLQIILVVYMYNSIGNGRYWKVLLYGSIFGFGGALLEHIFIAWQNALPETDKEKTSLSILLLIAEVGWIATEFAVPILNLIKLNSLSNVTVVKAVNVVTAVLFCGFAFFRFQIGYNRFTEHTVDCQKCTALHSQAFGVMAITDIILSIMIFFRINKSSKEYKIKKNNENISILTTFKKSSVFSLLIVDVISVFLSLTYIKTATQDYAKPFHALKSNFLLILAVDAFIFKFRAHTSGGSTYKSYNDMHTNSVAQSVNASNMMSNYKQQKSMLNSAIGKFPSTTSIPGSAQPNISINGFNLSSQPITHNYKKSFGLFKNELLNDDTEIDIESPRPAATPSNITKFTSNTYMYDGSDENNNLQFSSTSINNMGLKPSRSQSSNSNFYGFNM
ncbi:hypothetical protein H8356DRAFT_1659889 [Neocallimastix lanati (nom. inval.)]|nr:hypothetical protein H8356DRAFT_1659889 [Neocallimastix sp. JGI-2020a]